MKTVITTPAIGRDAFPSTSGRLNQPRLPRKAAYPIWRGAFITRDGNLGGPLLRLRGRDGPAQSLLTDGELVYLPVELPLCDLPISAN